MEVIAIDGPAGSGKSTVARRLAEHLGLAYLDTGAMYRGVTFAALRNRVDVHDADAVAALAGQVRLELAGTGIHVDGDDATAAIRGPEVTAAVSTVAANPRVREILVDRQRAWASAHDGGVVEGRDIGTVVFPRAALKVFLTAAPEVRAARRAQEVAAPDTAAVEADLARRDTQDSQRAASPLARAPDALVVDTSERSVEAIVDLLLNELGERRG